MAKFQWKRESISKVKGNIQAWSAKRQKLFTLALAAWSDDTVAEIRNEIKKVGAFDQGILEAATTRTQPQLRGTKLTVLVFNPLEYATVIEWGRRPGGRVPLLPLVGWAKRKGIISHVPTNISFDGEWADKWAASGAILRNMKKGKGKGNSKPMDPEIHDLLVVRLIAQKIFEKGSKGRHPFSIAWDRRAKTFKTDIISMLELAG